MWSYCIIFSLWLFFVGIQHSVIVLHFSVVTFIFSNCLFLSVLPFFCRNFVSVVSLDACDHFVSFCRCFASVNGSVDPCLCLLSHKIHPCTHLINKKDKDWLYLTLVTIIQFSQIHSAIMMAGLSIVGFSLSLLNYILCTLYLRSDPR